MFHTAFRKIADVLTVLSFIIAFAIAIKGWYWFTVDLIEEVKPKIKQIIKNHF